MDQQVRQLNSKKKTFVLKINCFCCVIWWVGLDAGFLILVCCILCLRFIEKRNFKTYL